MPQIPRTLAAALVYGMFGTTLITRVGAEESAAVEPVAVEATPNVAPAIQIPNLCGDWCGTWNSRGTGHRGPLRASFTQIDSCHYRVRFQGRFCKVIPFHYTTTLTVTGTANGQVFLGGSERLGLLLGTFRMTGSASGNQFVATYQSKDDCGQFTLQRCCR